MFVINSFTTQKMLIDINTNRYIEPRSNYQNFLMHINRKQKINSQLIMQLYTIGLLFQLKMYHN